MTEPDEALKFAEAMMRSYDHPSDVVIPPTAPLRIDGGRLTGIEAYNVTQAFAHAYRAGQAASAERIKALEEALEKSNKPRWFYYADDEGSPFDSVQDAVQAMVDELDPEDYLPNGTQVLRIDTLRDCAPIYAAVRFLSEAEREARDDGFLFEVTECATEAEAEALLKEADQ
jgi:hypothetical protein